jgi:hypothetical protein
VDFKVLKAIQEHLADQELLGSTVVMDNQVHLVFPDLPVHHLIIIKRYILVHQAPQVCHNNLSTNKIFFELNTIF